MFCEFKGTEGAFVFLQLSWIFSVITGGGVVGCLSLDWGVFAVSSVFFPFLLIGPEGDAIFEE